MGSLQAAAPGQGRKGSKAFFAASLTAQICALLRYVLLARLLGPEQLGLAVALILTAQFFELVSDSGGDRFRIQDPSGNEPEVQKLVHLVWLGRGLAIAALLAALAVPLARFYGEPALVGGFLALAAAPLVAGFAHLDYRRMQRGSDFRGEGQVLFLSELASLLATAAAAWLLRDFTAILYGLITRSAVIVLVSHLFAERRYALGFASAHARRLAAFGLPLMLNGLLLFAGSQGDRLLIGKQVGLAELGVYSAMILLIYYPTGTLQKVLTTMHLPLIAGAAKGGDRARAMDRLGGQTLLLGLAMLVGYALVAPFAIPLLYGAGFRQPALLVAATGVLQVIRFLRLWPVTAALAIGRSRTVLLSNVLRLLAFPFAFLSVDWLGGLFGILLAFALGEALALLVSLMLVTRQLGARRRAGLKRVGLFATISALVIGWAAAADRGAGTTGWLLLIGGSLASLAWLGMRERRTLAEGIDFLRRRRPRTAPP